MKPHHLLTALLVAANAAGGGALAALVGGLNVSWPGLPAVLALGVGLGHVSLGSAWLAWGRWPLVARSGGFLLIAMAWSYPSALCAGDKSHVPAWGGILLLYGLLVAAPLAILRLDGYTLSLEGAERGPARGARPLQFTVGGVLSLTTLVAMMLGTARYLEFPWHELLGVALFCALSAAAVTLGMVLAFQLPRGWSVVALQVVLGAGLGYLLRFTLLPPRPYEALIWMSLAQATVICLAALVLRTAGYRLRRAAGNNGKERASSGPA